MFAKLWNFLFKKRRQESVEAEAADEPATGTDTADAKVPIASSTPSVGEEISIEELCELRDGMTHEEMRAHLAVLYRRHNRAASSLNPELRAHAERMLDAIVEARHRYLEKDSY